MHRSSLVSAIVWGSWRAKPRSVVRGWRQAWRAVSAAPDCGRTPSSATSAAQRYGGTVKQFTGDGLMALFGAPVALEDHAIRACLAALDIQAEAGHLATEVQLRDNIALRLRVGLNSGRVVAGEIGSGISGYAAIGETVGYAQRMESVAPHGGVMLSEATARLVETAAVLKDTLTPTRRICCCSMICSASPTTKSHCPRSIRTRAGAG